MDDVDYFIFHQASRHMLTCLREMLRIPEEKVPILLRETGNTVSSSIPIVIESLFRTGRTGGATVLLCGFGVGLSWASTIVRFEKSGEK